MTPHYPYLFDRADIELPKEQQKLPLSDLLLAVFAVCTLLLLVFGKLE